MSINKLKVSIREFCEKHNTRTNPIELVEVHCVYRENYTWRNANSAGVYLFSYSADFNEILYIGKSSMNNTLGQRLAYYFQKNKELAVKIDQRFIRDGENELWILIVPTTDSYMAPALEEYLISIFRPSFNILGNKKGTT